MKASRSPSRNRGQSGQKVRLEYITIYDIKFEIKNHRKDGALIVRYDQYQPDRDSRSRTVAFPLISVWVDQNRQSAIKAHVKVDHRSPDQEQFFRKMLIEGRLEDKDDSRMWLTIDTARILRYGIGNNQKYQNSVQEGGGSGGYRIYYAYNSHAAALREILAAIQQHVPLSGLKLLNLASLSPNILREIGYQEVRDELNRGVPMWLGNPDSVINAGGVYQSREAKQANCKAFLEILEKYWKKEQA